MHDSEIKALARDIYIKTRNLTDVLAELTKKDYVVSYNTLKRWKIEGEWNDWAAKYDQRLAEFNEATLSFEKEILLDLITLSNTLRGKIKSKPDDSQLIYSYLGVVKQIQELQKKEKVNEAQIIDEVIVTLLSDPVIGPVIKSRQKEVMKILVGK